MNDDLKRLESLTKKRVLPVSLNVIDKRLANIAPKNNRLWLGSNETPKHWYFNCTMTGGYFK